MGYEDEEIGKLVPTLSRMAIGSVQQPSRLHIRDESTDRLFLIDTGADIFMIDIRAISSERVEN